jgi:hypothetical protein
MAHDNRWTLRRCDHSMCGQLNDWNSTSDDTQARSTGDWGKTALTGGPRLSAMVVR